MLDGNLIVFCFTKDDFDGKVFGAQVVAAHPGAHVDALAQADLTIAPAVGVEFQAGPPFAHLFLPRSQRADLLVAILLDAHGLLNFRHVEERGVFFYHAPHTERGSAGAYGLFHNADPAMRDAARALLVVRGDNFVLERRVERQAIGLVLGVGVVIFAFLADGPAVPAIEALGPPAIQHAEIGLPVERGFLPAGPAGLVRANGIVEPYIGAGDQVTRHIDVVVFQENDLAPEGVAA